MWGDSKGLVFVEQQGNQCSWSAAGGGRGGPVSETQAVDLLAPVGGTLESPFTPGDSGILWRVWVEK